MFMPQPLTPAHCSSSLTSTTEPLCAFFKSDDFYGIGVTKQQFLPLEQSAELIDLQRDLKRVFDPKELLNPGKIFPARSHRAC